MLAWTAWALVDRAEVMSGWGGSSGGRGWRGSRGVGTGAGRRGLAFLSWRNGQ